MSDQIMNDATRNALTALLNRSLSETVAGKAAAKIHGLDKAAEIAKRVKDEAALERALIAKLEGQRDFAAEYRGLFPDGGDRRSESFQMDSAVHLKRDEWCLSFGFHDRTVRRWLGLLIPEKFTEKKNAILDHCWKLAELWQAANYSSESDEWYTPPRHLEPVREVLGHIDLDPASCAQANNYVRAERFFTKEDNGLEQTWHGRNFFLNPPYGKTQDNGSLAGVWCNKAIAEYAAGNVEAGIILVNSLHSQPWQAPLYEYPICLVHHRIRFISGDGEENKNPTSQNMFVYLGRDEQRFARVFSKLGYPRRKFEVADEAPDWPRDDGGAR